MSDEIEITDSISKKIEYPPPNKELCDWCLKWVSLEEITITDRYEFVCINCLEKEEENK